MARKFAHDATCGPAVSSPSSTSLELEAELSSRAMAAPVVLPATEADKEEPILRVGLIADVQYGGTQSPSQATPSTSPPTARPRTSSLTSFDI